MSRAYRISIAESVRREIVAADEIRSRLDVLPILQPEATAKLLHEELRARGFVERVDGALVRNDGDCTLIIDPCTGEVSVKVELKRVAVEEGTRAAIAWDDLRGGDNSEAIARKSLRRDLEEKVKRQDEKLQQKTTALLEQRLADLQPELAAIANAVTRTALKQRAAQLGDVKEIREDADAGTLTITVEV